MQSSTPDFGKSPYEILTSLLRSHRTPAGGASHISGRLETVSPILFLDAWCLFHELWAPGRVETLTVTARMISFTSGVRTERTSGCRRGTGPLPYRRISPGPDTACSWAPGRVETLTVTARMISITSGLRTERTSGCRRGTGPLPYRRISPGPDTACSWAPGRVETLTVTARMISFTSGVRT